MLLQLLFSRHLVYEEVDLVFKGIIFGVEATQLLCSLIKLLLGAVELLLQVVDFELALLNHHCRLVKLGLLILLV